MRVQFDATLDDFVDVSQRSLKQSKEVGSQWSKDRVYSALSTLR